MMSAHDVEIEILAPMQASFLPPRPEMSTEDKALALRDYVRTLSHFNAETLRAAWGSMVANHHGRAWPVPGRIVAAALHVERESRRERELAQPKRDFQQERDKYWREVCRANQARWAAKVGVAWSLKCAIVDDGMKLFQVDLKKLVRAHESAEKMHARIEANLPLGEGRGVLHAADREIAMAMYHNLLVNEAKTAKEIADASPTGSSEIGDQ